MNRDSQRSKVYAWEQSLRDIHQARGTLDLAECAEYTKRVWRSERGRYGLAKRAIPEVRAGRGGGHAGPLGDYIELGRWARQPAVVLHEIAHCLAPGGRDHSLYHGPRFVGVLIGLFCRHLGADRDELLAAAAEHGVKVNLTAIGAVPSFGWHRRVFRALQAAGGRATEMDLAVALGVSYRVVQGALLTIFRQGRARRRRGQIEVRHIAPEHLLRLP